jgi:hypothetical protein
VGIYIHERRAFVAACFRNPMDMFNVRLARRIICQRIVSAIQGNNRVRYVTTIDDIPPGVGSRRLMYRLRQMFKPDPYEQDETFSVVSEYGGIEVRSILTADDAWTKIEAFVSKIKLGELVNT